MHPHIPTNITFMIVSPVASILLAIIFMVIIDRTLTARGSEIIAPILGTILLIGVPLIGIALPFLL